jgi:hypothetical protein
MCHEIIVEHDGLLEWLTYSGRGFWTPRAETHTRNALSAPENHTLRFSDVTDALREVAVLPSGLIRSPQDFDAFTFCHKQGYLDVEPCGARGEQRRYLFSSPLHRRYVSLRSEKTRIAELS